MQTVAGVLGSQLVSSATIPVDDDVSQGRFTGYAIANPGNSSITVSVTEVSADGETLTTLSPIKLDARCQKAGFLVRDPSAAQLFKGSAVLTGQGGATFSVVALVEVQGTGGVLFTAIPVIQKQ